MSKLLRDNLTLLNQRANKRFNMFLKRITDDTPIKLKTTKTIKVLFNSSDVKATPTQINKSGTIKLKSSNKNIKECNFSDVENIEDKITLLEIIGK